MLVWLLPESGKPKWEDASSSRVAEQANYGPNYIPEGYALFGYSVSLRFGGMVITWQVLPRSIPILAATCPA